jgi:hypothetical protein
VAGRTQSFWPANVEYEATFPRVFDLTNRVTTSLTLGSELDLV